ncbi:MAG: MFS transporter [Planctomycetes bacterium]|nr:MFS transporter [Planctomycetota bacterium]
MSDHASSVPAAATLTERERRLLFWASFLALAAAGTGFAFRVALGETYGAELGLTKQQVGEVFGASLWPIAITMILFSLVVDRTGYKLPMIGAFVLQAASGIGTWMASGHLGLYFAALAAGLGHGIVEAVINPVCAAVYPREKTKRLTILHAAWPAGLVLGTLLVIGGDSFGGGLSWRTHALWILVPAVPYVIMFLPCRFPVDERVAAGVPFREMLRQVGFLTAFLASGLMFYEIGNQVYTLTELNKPDEAGNLPFYVEHWFSISAVLGAVFGIVFGGAVKSLGQPLFFLLCVLMIPVATAELGTDGWIKGLMEPVLAGRDINPAMALVFSASIMLILRVFAGSILRFFNPPALLCVSGLLSAAGLYWLSTATGIAIFIAFVLYALGQTYYWPCVLGFTSERYPQGGALTLNTVSAIGLLSAGIVGGPLLGVAFDRSIHDTVKAEAPALATAATSTGGFMWMTHEKIDPKKAGPFVASLPEAERAEVEQVYHDAAPKGAAQVKARRDVLAYATRFPLLLFVAFGAIALWFRSRGGYKQIHLETSP